MEIIINGRLKRVPDRLGVALIKMGKASPTETAEPTPARKSKRKYQRRDMKAED